MNLSEYEVIPGRGLVSQKAIEMRNEYLKNKGFEITEIEKTGLVHSDVQKNIESMVGSVEIPTGVVGPLIFNYENKSEPVYCLGGTLEGALIASMNRGAKAISLSGGFSAQVVRQKMVRAPLFIFSSDEEATAFGKWILERTDSIRETAESYSNHAKLISLETEISGSWVNTLFTYTTGDAAGQNMTTTCTWHAILWALEQFRSETGIVPKHFTLEGNGSSDKKVSQFLIDHGRGTKVIAECELAEEVIHKVLRTSSDAILAFYLPSRTICRQSGMIGYNINVANAVAAIFVATGQDLASIHESSTADFEIEKTDRGLRVKLTLYSLVIGTVGGGTHVPKQKQALKFMGCQGTGKLNRFASLIAGFAMGLELSTYAALASGEFAKAHEKLGRNKPIEWLQWNEVNLSLIRKITAEYLPEPIISAEISKGDIDNGILMNLSKRVNSKLLGFIPVEVSTEHDTFELVIKSKALDLEVIKGLHLMAASIDPALSDLLSTHREHLEYMRSHEKELAVAQFMKDHQIGYSPEFFGTFSDVPREIYLLAQERLHSNKMLLMDSENHPEKWDDSTIRSVITAISDIQLFCLDQEEKTSVLPLNEVQIIKAFPLYQKMLEIVLQENPETDYNVSSRYFDELKQFAIPQGIRKTLIHNDYNPRNIAIRNNAAVCIYDWELSVLHYPFRDVIEFLSFVLPANFSQETLIDYLQIHYRLTAEKHSNQNWEDWKKGHGIALREFVISRLLFYKTAEILMKLKFVDRVFVNCIRMIELLES